MLVRVGNKMVLEIFTRFEKDHGLLKHTRRLNDKSAEPDKMSFSANLSWANSASGDVISTSVVSNSGEKRAPGLLDRVLGFFGYIRGESIAPAKLVEVKKPTKTVDLVFDCVVKDDEQIKDIGAKIEKFKVMIEQAHALGQKALEEELTEKWQVYCYEAQLVANKMIKAISEDRLVDFVADCEKGLRLDWIKNFTRVIPASLAQKKLDLDKLEIFDNYVILHYDPENKNNKWTKEEIARELEKRRDPILFGVIEGSHKLYYVGDWKDEYCDLTWEQIAEKVAENALRLE